MEDDAQLTQQQLERLAGKAIHPEAGAGGAAVGSGGAGGSRSGLSFPITSSGGKQEEWLRQGSLECKESEGGEG